MVDQAKSSKNVILTGPSEDDSRQWCQSAQVVSHLLSVTLLCLVELPVGSQNFGCAAARREAEKVYLGVSPSQKQLDDRFLSGGVGMQVTDFKRHPLGTIQRRHSVGAHVNCPP
jgi:hypothetical protein